jgi:hypothetical protein
MGRRAGVHRRKRSVGLLAGLLLTTTAAAQVRPVTTPPTPPAPTPKPPPAPAGVTPAELRAGTLVKLAGYLAPDKTTQRRADAPAPAFRLGLLGHDEVTAAARTTVPGKPVGDGKATVVVVDSLAAVEGRAADVCDLLYVARSVEDKVLARVVAVHADQPMPIVCERPGFAASGGSIQLFTEDADLRFEVNVAALQRQGMKASPQLLKLSRPGPGR